MHNIIIDGTSIVPIFIQVAEWLKEEILQGNISEGNQVPSVNQIVAMSFIVCSMLFFMLSNMLYNILSFNKKKVV